MGIYLRMKSNNKLKTILLAWSLVIFVLAGCQPKTIVDRALNGNLLHQVWKQEVGGPLNHPPLRVGDVLIAAPIRSPLAGLDVETGKVLWQYDPGIRIWDRAYAADGQRVFVGLDGGNLGNGIGNQCAGPSAGGGWGSLCGHHLCRSGNDR